MRPSINRAASPPHLNVATVAAQEIRVGNRIEFSNVVSLNAAIVQKILSRLQTASKDIITLQAAQNDVSEFSAEVQALKTGFSGLSASVNEEMNLVKSNVADLVVNLGNINEQYANADDVALLNNNVQNVQSRQSEIQGYINDINYKLGSLQDFDANEIKSDVANLKIGAAEVTTSIGNINNNIQNIQSRQDQLQTSLDNINSQIGELLSLDVSEILRRLSLAEGSIVNIDTSLQNLSADINLIMELLTKSIVVFQ